MKTCIFCERSLRKGNRAREHVFPVWLVKKLGIRAEDIYGTHYRPYSKDKKILSQKRDFELKNLSLRKQKPGSFIYGLVCTSCNGGFLNDIEKQARPILTRMMDGRRLTLQENMQKNIAIWGYKTAILLNRTSNFHKMVNSKRFENFFKNKVPPEDVRVSIAMLKEKLEGKDLWVQTQFSGQIYLWTSSFVLTPIFDKTSGLVKDLQLLPKGIEILQLLKSLSFTIILNLHGALIRITYLPVDIIPMEVSEIRNGAVRIWPITEREIDWPVKESFDSLVQLAANYRVRLI